MEERKLAYKRIMFSLYYILYWISFYIILEYVTSTSFVQGNVHWFKYVLTYMDVARGTVV